VMTDPGKRDLRREKRERKRIGTKRRRLSWKRDLLAGPERAEPPAFDFGPARSADLNGLDKDATRRKKGREEDEPG
jgi:hypothetical protein